MPRIETGLSFNGPAADALAIGTPFYSANKIDISGILGGESMDDQGWFDYHPIGWKANDITPNLIQMNVAKIGHGKTTLADHIAANYSALRIGGDDNLEMKLWADNIRKLHGEIELGRLADFFDSEVVGAFGQRLNPFDMGYGLDRDQQVGFVESQMVQANNGEPLKRHTPYALRIATDWMFRDYADHASLDVLGELMRVLDSEAETAYRRARPLAARIGVDSLPEGLQRLTESKGGLSLDEFRADSFYGYELLDKVVTQYSGRFGGRGTDAEMLKQRAVIYDLSDLEDEAIVMNQQFNWLIRNNANAKQNRDFMFQIDIHDENWKLWNYPTYANAMYAYLKQIRSYETLVLMNTHRPNDYQTVGSEGSQEREKATKMLSDVGIWYVGYQEAADANEIKHLIGLNGTEEKRLGTLRKGQWGVKVGAERMMFVDTTSVYTNQLRQMSYSNQALNVLMNRSARSEEERAYMKERATA